MSDRAPPVLKASPTCLGRLQPPDDVVRHLSGSQLPVRAPAVIVSSTAFSMAAASASKSSEWRSSIAHDKIIPMGLAMPLPAMSGAEP